MVRAKVSKKIFLLLFLPACCFSENYCDAIDGANIKATYRIIYDGNTKFDTFQFCNQENENRYFLLLEHHPQAQFLQDFVIVDSDKNFQQETMVQEFVQSNFTKWIISLTKKEYLFVTEEFNKLDANKSKDIAGPVDFTCWCFASLEKRTRCFWMDSDSEADKFKELANLKNFVESKFPKALKSN